MSRRLATPRRGTLRQQELAQEEQETAMLAAVIQEILQCVHLCGWALQLTHPIQSSPQNRSHYRCPSCKNLTLAFGSYDPSAPNMTTVSHSAQ